VCVIAATEGDILALTVEDNGIGIGEDDLPRIGKPFFQARGSYDRRHDGTGLGLSIVKGLVTLHGGDVTIRSRVGEGTCITVRMPIDCEEARPQAAQPKAIKLAPRAPAESGVGVSAREPAMVVKKSA
jgi:cell cycle sensor histidine kinase DivJ